MPQIANVRPPATEKQLEYLSDLIDKYGEWRAVDLARRYIGITALDKQTLLDVLTQSQASKLISELKEATS